MFQTEQKTTIRHEQEYYWFTIPRFKLKTKTCGKRDTSGRRGLFHMDQSRLLSSRGSEGKKQSVLLQQILFSQRSESLCSEGSVSVYQTSIHTLLELQNILSLWWGVSKWVIEELFLHLRLFIRDNGFFFLSLWCSFTDFQAMLL